MNFDDLVKHELNYLLPREINTSNEFSFKASGYHIFVKNELEFSQYLKEKYNVDNAIAMFTEKKSIFPELGYRNHYEFVVFIKNKLEKSKIRATIYAKIEKPEFRYAFINCDDDLSFIGYRKIDKNELLNKIIEDIKKHVKNYLCNLPSLRLDILTGNYIEEVESLLLR
jgi:hypothetical protein